MTSDYCRVTVQWLFSKIFLIAWNVQKTLFDSRPTVAWPQPLSRDRLATFSKFSQIAWNVQKTLFDSRPTVAWPPTTVAWPFSDFFQIVFYLLETSKKRWLTVGRRSRDLRPLSRDSSATFFKKFPYRLKRPKTLFDSCSTVAWPPTTVAWPFSDFFKNFSKLLQTSKNVVWQSVDVRVTSVHCRVTPVTFFRVCFVRLLHTLAYVVFLVFLLLLSAKSLATYLLLQEWSDPGNFDIISKLGIGRKEFLILAGKFQLVDSPWGEQVPHYKHRRRSITYLLREIPVKNRERWDRSQQTGK